MTPSRQTMRRAAAAAVMLSVLTACGMTPSGNQGSDDEPPAPSTIAPTPGEVSEPPEADPLPTGAAGTPRPGLPTKVNTKSADSVGKAALTVMWTSDTTIDVSQHDATLRALRYCTAKYAKQLKGGPPRSAPGAEWNRWAEHKAYTRVTLQPADDAGRPADTATDAYRTWLVTVTPHGDDGWTDKAEPLAAYVHLTRPGSSAAWKVDTVQVQ